MHRGFRKESTKSSMKVLAGDQQKHNHYKKQHIYAGIASFFSTDFLIVLMALGFLFLPKIKVTILKISVPGSLITAWMNRSLLELFRSDQVCNVEEKKSQKRISSEATVSQGNSRAT